MASRYAWQTVWKTFDILIPSCIAIIAVIFSWIFLKLTFVTFDTRCGHFSTRSVISCWACGTKTFARTRELSRSTKYAVFCAVVCFGITCIVSYERSFSTCNTFKTNTINSYSSGVCLIIATRTCDLDRRTMW